jgi:formiminotetrahydrofolate cyclodeaminase
MTGNAPRPEPAGRASDEVIDYLGVSVDGLLDLIAAPEPAPAGGSAAALAATMAAALAVMTARLSVEHWELAGAATAQAQLLRDRLGPLARDDAVAYLHALERMRQAARSQEEPESPTEQRDRDRELAAALSDAAEIPLRIAESAADVAELAADIAQFGNPAVSADAAAAVAMAGAAAKAAAHIVGVNLGVSDSDEMLSRARRAAEAAEAASARAFAAVR